MDYCLVVDTACRLKIRCKFERAAVQKKSLQEKTEILDLILEKTSEKPITLTQQKYALIFQKWRFELDIKEKPNTAEVKTDVQGKQKIPGQLWKLVRKMPVRNGLVLRGSVFKTIS